MTGLVILAVLVALISCPTHGYDVDANGKGHRVNRPSTAAYLAWAAVCVAMVAGLVTWAVLR